ncbi:hypothetical protein ACFQ60_33065 [Streptomyces zhihengii]
MPEIVSALSEMADLWLESDTPVQVSPLDSHFQIVLRHLNPDAPRVYFNQREWMSVMVVDTPGTSTPTETPTRTPTPVSATSSPPRSESCSRGHASRHRPSPQSPGWPRTA